MLCVSRCHTNERLGWGAGSPPMSFWGFLFCILCEEEHSGIQQFRAKAEPSSPYAINEGPGHLHKPIDILKRRCQSH